MNHETAHTIAAQERVQDRREVLGLAQELGALSRRISLLRGKQPADPDELLAALDTALVELEVAEEELHACMSELDAANDRIAARIEGADLDWEASNTAFRELPVPVLLLGTDGLVHRTNDAVAVLLGRPTDLLVGKPVATFVHAGYRRRLRTALAAARHGGPQGPLPLLLDGVDGAVELRVQISRLATPQSVRPLLSIVGLPSDQDSGDGRQALTADVHRLDSICRLTRLLVGEHYLDERDLLGQVARLLAAEFTAEVAVFLTGSDGLRRVAGCPEPGTGAGAGVGAGSAAGAGTGLVGPRRPAPEVEGPSARAVSRAARGVHDTGRALLQPSDRGAAPGLGGALLGVPLSAEVGALGVLVLVRSRNRPDFAVHDLGLLEELGRQIAMSVRTERIHRRQANAAQILQSSLLPGELPSIPGIQVAGSYRAPLGDARVGGDFYDAFPANGGWGLLLGDVCGKGVEAAATTAAVRHGVRVLSVWESSPGAVLRKMSQAMTAHSEESRFVTTCYVHLRPGRGTVRARVASAGHLPAAVVAATGTVRYLRGGGCPLGLPELSEVAVEEVALGLGDLLLLYSDGVTEARDREGRFFEEHGLTETLVRAAGQSAEAVVESVEQQVLRFAGGPPQDDMALLAVRITSVGAAAPTAASP